VCKNKFSVNVPRRCYNEFGRHLDSWRVLPWNIDTRFTSVVVGIVSFILAPGSLGNIE
jgi:hypothetical protein